MPPRIHVLFIACCLLAVSAFEAESLGQASLPMVSVDFEGGDAAGYIASLRRQSPDLNIVEFGNLAAIEMPRVKLQNVSFKQALGLLNGLETQRGATEYQAAVTSDIAPHSAVFSVYVESRTQRGSQSPVRTEVWSVADLVGEDGDADRVLTAIETAIELADDDGHEEAALRYHAESRLVIARGRLEDIESIGRVIDSLYDQPHSTHDMISELREREQIIVAELDQMRANQDRAHEELEHYVRENAQLRARAELLQNELVEMQRRSDIEAAERRAMMERTHQLEMEMHMLRQELEKPGGEDRR